MAKQVTPTQEFRVDVLLPLAQRKIREAVFTGSVLSLEDALKACRAVFPSKSRADVLSRLIKEYPVFRRIA